MSNANKLIGFLAIIILIGCNTKDGNTEGILTSKDFYKGTSSLKMEFLPNSPPKEIYEESEFILGISLGNDGAYDIKEGILTLGVESDYIRLPELDKAEKWRTDIDNSVQIDSNKLGFGLKGKDIYTPMGEQGNIFLALEAKKLASQSQALKSNIAATACYTYKTTAVSTVCIDTDITNTHFGEKGCVVKDIAMDSQGAPVAVTAINYKMLPRGPNFVKPEFIITIENKGNGEVIYPDDRIISALCGKGEMPSDIREQQLIFNVVIMKVFLSRGIDRPLKCSPSSSDGYTSLIRLKEGKGIARCTLEEGVDAREGTFTTPLQIVVDYGYTSTISQEVLIKKPEK